MDFIHTERETILSGVYRHNQRKIPKTGEFGAIALGALAAGAAVHVIPRQAESHGWWFGRDESSQPANIPFLRNGL